MEKSRIPSGRRKYDRMVTLQLPPCTLGEGPLWHSETEEFVFTDIVNGLLYAWSPETGKCRTLLDCDCQLGAFLFDTLGNLILFTEKGVYSCPYGAQDKDWTLLFSVPMVPGERFNDAICDPKGRMIAGTKTEENLNGSLYLFETEKEPRLLMNGLMISNGMGFSSDSTAFYHTDSGRRSIYRYTYDAEAGTIIHPFDSASVMTDKGGPFGELIWEETHEDQAVPDGMTVDAQGHIWTAFWGRGCIGCIDPSNKSLLDVISFPATQISSLTFGGKNLSQLLVTSASVGTSGASEGQIYAISLNCTGREEYRFRRF